MDILETIFTRRSVRLFTAEPVPADLLEQVLRAGAASPSASNMQAWGFVTVQSPERLAAMRSLAPGILGQPAAVVAVCVDGGRALDVGGAGGEHMAAMDIGMAAENMLLAAHGLGLGACPVGSFHHQAVATFLRLPATVEPVLLLTLGHPKVKPAAPARRGVPEVCFRERWGVPYGG